MQLAANKKNVDLYEMTQAKHMLKNPVSVNWFDFFF